MDKLTGKAEWLDKMFPVDLESSYLYLKTTSAVGSNDVILLLYYDEVGNTAGGFHVVFEDGGTSYGLANCFNNVIFFSQNLPTEDDKHWVIEKRGHKTVVYCNDVKVGELVASSETCDHPGVTDIWATIWDRKVAKIKFTTYSEYDSAVDSFYIGEFIYVGYLHFLSQNLKWYYFRFSENSMQLSSRMVT